MRRFHSPLLVLLLLVGLLGITVYAVAECGGKAGCCRMKAGCSIDAAKMGGCGGVTATRAVGDIVVSAAHRNGSTLLTVTTRTGRPSTDVVTAKLNGQEVVLRPAGPGKYAFGGPVAGKLSVSVRNLWSTETASFNLVPASKCPLAGKCNAKSKPCACAADCKSQCKTTARSGCRRHCK